MFASKNPNYRKQKYFLSATHLKSLWGDNVPTLAYFFPLYLAVLFIHLFSYILFDPFICGLYTIF